MAEDLPDPIQEAKALFFQYDGSHFYMSHDGVLDSYLRAHVSPGLEAVWLAEMKANKLAELDEPGNWKTIHFLAHHSMLDCGMRLLSAEPLGELWERIAFLEGLLSYAKKLPSADRKAILGPVRRKVSERATTELHRTRSERMRNRIEGLLEVARNA